MILLVIISLMLTFLVVFQSPQGEVVNASQLVKASQGKTLVSKLTWGLGMSLMVLTLILM